MIKFYLSFLAVVTLGMTCINVPENAEDYPPAAELIITIESEYEHQTLNGFGASDAWSVQFVGKNWPLEKRNQIADLLFSKKFDQNGKPDGIGLNIWRFNIGAGSMRQGDESGIEDVWRRAESFLQDDLSYDWSSKEGQQWFLRAARKRGADTFIGFVNSPPVQWTKTGKAYGDGGYESNLADEHYDDFAEYLADVANHFEAQDVGFRYISPVNEPQWNWSQENNQEGSPYLNHEIKQLVNEIDTAFRKNSVSAQIEIPESAQINFLYGDGPDHRGHQAAYFAGNPETAITGLSTVADKLAGHSYFTTWPVSDLISHRQKLASKMEELDGDITFSMSEYCILEDNEELIGPSRDLGMDPALYMARVIHHDLTIANASSWQWWLGISPYDYKDGLVYIDKDKDNGSFYESKKLWALGNYSRFVLPGSVRIETNRNDDASLEQQASELMVSAYLTPENKLVVVVVNYSRESISFRLSLANNIVSITNWNPYVTNENMNLKPGKSFSADESVTVHKRSVTTFVSE